MGPHITRSDTPSVQAIFGFGVVSRSPGRYYLEFNAQFETTSSSPSVVSCCCITSIINGFLESTLPSAYRAERLSSSFACLQKHRILMPCCWSHVTFVLLLKLSPVQDYEPLRVCPYGGLRFSGTTLGSCTP